MTRLQVTLAVLALGAGVASAAAAPARSQPDPRFPVPNPNVAADTSSPAYMHGWMNAQHLIAVAGTGGWTAQEWVALMGGPHAMCLQNAQTAYISAQPLSGDGPLANYDVDQDYQGCMKALQLQLESG